MMTIFLLFSACGLAFIISEGEIMSSFRNLCNKVFKSDFVSCSQCVGFWSGALVGVFATISEIQIVPIENAKIESIVLMAFATSYLCVLTSSLRR
jgi:hypothetical protein